MELADKQRAIAEWHAPNRVAIAAKENVAVDKFFSFMPLICHSCHREMKVSDLEFSHALHFQCKSASDCAKARTKMLRVRFPNSPSAVEAASKSERGGSGKKVRCPDCGTKKPKKIRKKGAPKWKCLNCERVWDRDVPGEAPQEPSEALEAVEAGADEAERPRKRQKPAKKQKKKAK